METFDPTARKFLFKCADCAMMVEISLTKKEEIDQVIKNEMELDCPCKGISTVVLD